ncbi:MAG TPA: glycosyltransferase family 39 protein [Gemmatimonadales bacterium]|nr:glycosyltransferase family 39 protein [Gemmatimonadales bacterium]
MTAIKRAFERNPLLAVLILGAALRVVAAYFSRGFLAIDDHHVLIYRADQLASGVPLPPDYKRSILYPGSVALMMDALRAVGHPSPDFEMLVVRLAHAGFAVLGIYFAYRILERAAGGEAAALGGLLMATFFPLPVTSVHQFEEAVCQVPMLAGCWWLLKADRAERHAELWSFLSGAAIMTTLVLRFPALPFVVAFAAVALWQPAQRFRKPYFVLGLLAVFALQATSNAVINGDPWYYFFETARHRAGAGAVGYPTGPFWKYIATLVGVFLPPFSFLFLAAAINGGRRFPLLGIPALAFLIGTSVVANKQERFLLPLLPLLLILGAIGTPAVREWFARRGWTSAYRWAWGYFAAVNTALLVVGLFSYGKKDRVAPLVYLEGRHDATGVIVAQFAYTFPVPVYYLGRPQPRLFVFSDKQRLSQDAQAVRAASPPPNYLILYSDSIPVDESLLERTLAARLQLATTIGPSLGDQVAHLVNPRRNRATTAVVLSIAPLSAAPR